jgi:uncharacterized protein YbaP (TraB family)
MKKTNTLAASIKVKTFTFIAVACIAGCAEAQQDSFKTSANFSLLWEITGEGTQKSYLYGTIHIYDSTMFRIPEEVYTAIDRCDNFVMEVDMDNVDIAMLQQRIAIDNPDSTLDKLLAPEIYEEMQNIPIIKMMGEGVNRIKPFFIQQYILIDNPMIHQSVDINLNSYAKGKSKNTSGIETLEEQFDMVDAVSLSEQSQGIVDIYNYCKRENLGFAEAGRKIFDAIQGAYKNQDFEKLVSLEDEFRMTSNSPVADSVMVGVRNINMADRIDGLIKQDKSAFIAVGALHLPDYKNMQGIVTLLGNKGYKLRPVLIDLNID